MTTENDVILNSIPEFALNRSSKIRQKLPNKCLLRLCFMKNEQTINKHYFEKWMSCALYRLFDEENGKSHSDNCTFEFKVSTEIDTLYICIFPGVMIHFHFLYCLMQAGNTATRNNNWSTQHKRINKINKKPSLFLSISVFNYKGEVDEKTINLKTFPWTVKKLCLGFLSRNEDHQWFYYVNGSGKSRKYSSWIM